jgi:hypothetical protein
MQTPTGEAYDCLCQSGETAISGGAFSGTPNNMLNATQAGPSFGASAQTWRVSCVQPTTGARVPCVAPFAVCLGGAGGAAVRIETSQCVPGTYNYAEDCTCKPNEVAVAGGAYTGTPNDMLNANQAGPSYGAPAQTWRVACVDPTGTRIPCVQSFAVCVAAPYANAVRVETAQCVEATADHAEDCTCNPDEVAISGGAYSGTPNNMLNATQAGPSYGASARTWRVACVDPTGARVACAQPFAVCASNGL